MNGRFITLEGGEGVGKSTQVKALAAAFQTLGIPYLTTREPGGTPGAEMIRDLILGGDEDRWGRRAEALLFAAARADHVEKVIAPALAKGRWVLSDRFVDSSLAYQSGAGGLRFEEVWAANAVAIGPTIPDRTLVLVLSEGQHRANLRDGGINDRIARRPDSYHFAVESTFRHLARHDPQRVRLIDASGTPEQVTARLLGELADLLP